MICGKEYVETRPNYTLMRKQAEQCHFSVACMLCQGFHSVIATREQGDVFQKWETHCESKNVAHALERITAARVAATADCVDEAVISDPLNVRPGKRK
jgi:hypothetical protein